MRRLSARLGLLLPLLLAMAAALVLASAPPPADAQEPGADDLPPARIEQLPTWHGGSAFTFELHFQSNPRLSYTVVRDDLFEVEGGRIERARRITQGSSLAWQVHVVPDGFGDVGITGLDMSASVPGPGQRLAARIADAPSGHDGEAFDVRLDFNHSPRFSFRTLRDEIVEATAGTVQRARRVTQGDNSAWTLTIQPEGDGTVGIAIPVTQTCDDDRAVCTRDGEMLAVGMWRTVDGPARDTLERPADTVREIETQPVIRNIQPAQSAPPDAGPTGQTGPTGQSEPPGHAPAGLGLRAGMDKCGGQTGITLPADLQRGRLDRAGEHHRRNTEPDQRVRSGIRSPGTSNHSERRHRPEQALYLEPLFRPGGPPATSRSR